MFNLALYLNYFPNQWKIGELVYFIKKGKPAGVASSYRPITLLPIFGKIYEKLIQKRMNFNLSNNNNLQQAQHGFLEGKSTETALQDLFSKIKLLSQKYKYISLASIDIKNAFDDLPWEETIQELQFLELPLIYINIIISFLSNRGAFPNWLTTLIHWFYRGCPQGSCLGPFLWRILLNTLIRILSEMGFHIIAYADDILLIFCGNTRRELESMGNEALQILSDWLVSHDLRLSYDKSTVLHLRRPHYLKRPPIFKIDGQTIRKETTLNYLGVLLDNTFSFLPHLSKKRQQITKITQNLLKFAPAKGGIKKPILKIWYNLILEKKVSYAAAVWYDKMQPSHGLRHLRAIQAQCMLTISGAYRKTATDALNVLTGIIPLNIQLERISTVGKVSRLGISTTTYSSETFQSKSLSSLVSPSIPYFHKLEDNHRLKFHNRIYTDGSKLEGECGFAFCVYEGKTLKYSQQKRLSSHNSVYQAELLALEEAISWSIANNIQRVLILTDSLSSLTAIEDIFSKNLIVINIIKLLQSTNTNIYFQWIRGHTGNDGNETADRLAKEATLLSSPSSFKYFPKPISYLKKTTKQQALINWQTAWDCGNTGRFTHALVPKVSEELLLPHRNLYLLATNHGPFSDYLYKFNKVDNPYCTCGLRGTSLHYIRECTLTAVYHLRKPNSLELHKWFKLILKNRQSCQKIIDCMSLIEKNQFIFQAPVAI